VDITIDQATGTVTDQARNTVGFVDSNGSELNLRAVRFGPVLAILQEDGTILGGDRYGPQLGYVELDGQVHSGSRNGPVVTTVQAPNLLVKAALHLLRF
jgi:topoisomerase IA-like protein